MIKTHERAQERSGNHWRGLLFLAAIGTALRVAATARTAAGQSCLVCEHVPGPLEAGTCRLAFSGFSQCCAGQECQQVEQNGQLVVTCTPRCSASGSCQTTGGAGGATKKEGSTVNRFTDWSWFCDADKAIWECGR